MNEPPAPAARQIVEDAWRDQAIWSEAANQLKTELSTWRYRAALAAVAGAFLQTLAAALAGAGVGWWWVRALIALAGAVVLAVVPYVLKTKASKEQVRAWVRARSASEALKEEIYRYLVGAPPFGPHAAPAELVARCQAIKDKVSDLAGHAYVEPPDKERPLELDANGYVEQRVNDQIEKYYRPKGRENAVRARKLYDLEFGLGLLAVVMGAAAGAVATTGLNWLAYLGPWVAVVTTAGGAVTAHLAASRYDHAAMTYAATASRLAGLRNAWLVDPARLDPARVARLVDDCENAISTENEAWLAEWTREEQQATASGGGS